MSIPWTTTKHARSQIVSRLPQNHAPPLDDQTPVANLRRALRALELEPVNEAVPEDDISRLLDCAIAHWPDAAKGIARLHQN